MSYVYIALFLIAFAVALKLVDVIRRPRQDRYHPIVWPHPGEVRMYDSAGNWYYVKADAIRPWPPAE